MPSILTQVHSYLTHLEFWQIVIALPLTAGMLLLWRFKRLLGVYIVLFFLAETFATAARLRETSPFIVLLPLFFGIPLLLNMLVLRERYSWGALAWVWISVMLLFGFRSMFSNAGINALFWASYYVVVLCLGIMLGSLLASLKHRLHVSKWLAYASVVTMLVGLSSLIIENPHAYRQGRLIPFGVQANIWGPTALAAVINCLLYSQLTKGAARKLTQAIMISISVVSLILSFSRGSIYSFAAALLLYWVLGGIRRAKGVLLGGLLALLIIGIFMYGVSKGTFQMEAATRLAEPKSTSRLELTIRLIQTHIATHPVLGVGFFESDSSTPQDIKRGDPHNSILQVWIEQGTVGMLFITTLLIWSLISALRIKRTWPIGTEERLIAKFCLFAMTAVFLDGLTVPLLWTHHAILGVQFSILIGVISSLALDSRLRRSSKTEDASVPLFVTASLAGKSYLRGNTQNA